MDIKVEITHLYKIIAILFFAFASIVGFITKNFYSEFKDMESLTSSNSSKIEIFNEELKELKSLILMNVIKNN
jgi:hypothetical protein